MKIFVNVPRGFLNKIREMVLEGRYSNIEEFIEAAIYNQLNLEDQDRPVTLDDIKLNDFTPLINRSKNLHTFQVSSNLIILKESGYESIKCLDLPTDEKTMPGVLWGQYNRILPIKFTLRILANMLIENIEPPSLDSFSKRVAEAARHLGHQLLDVDKTKKRQKGKKLSTAFPIGEDPYKSKNRFKNHFIGYVDSKGIIIGAPGKLKFINIFYENEVKIGITEPGLSFALLENPIFDEDLKNDSSLSEEEISFYLNHIFNHLKEERNALISILSGVSAGINRPDELTQHILDLNKGMTRSQAAIIRGGLISRMTELGLVSGFRLGMRGIEYRLTDSGMNLLELEGEISI